LACNIVIEGVFGLGQPMDTIRVAGTVEGCASDVEGNSVLVGLSCRSSDGPFQERFATVDHEGKWQAIFSAPVQNCECGAEVFATARCVSEGDCTAEPFLGEIKCVDCPALSFDLSGDDVGFLDVRTECDSDGTALVFIKFFVTNNTQNLVHLSINCGPGGTKVSGGSTGFTPGSSGEMESVCRYNPAITPNPQPFVEFFNVDFTPRGCPPFPIPVPTLPECPAECPTTVSVEVRDSDGALVDTEAVLCLAPGSYTVEVISPAIIPGIQFTWSVDGVLQPGATGSTFTVSVGAGQDVDLSVAVSIPGCPPLSLGVELQGCVIDCSEDLVLEVRNSQGQVVDLGQPCLAAGTYTIEAIAPTGPGWEFTWEIGGVIDTTTNQSQNDVDLGAGATVPVGVTAVGDGCPPKQADIELQGCGDGGDDDGGFFSCDGLLISAISLLIAGAVLVVISSCFGPPALEAVGAVMLIAGGVLFINWLIFCQAFTSCAVLERLRCLLAWLAILALLAAIVLTFSEGFACGLAAALAGIGWGGLAQLLSDIMVNKGCEIGTCILPSQTVNTDRLNVLGRRRARCRRR
jgi:hypothetical protein